MHNVVIAQEYVPGYRVPFFELLHKRARSRNIDIRVAYGEPNGAQARRGDSRSVEFAIPLCQREYDVAGRRLVVRRTRAAFAGADLLVLEQARRNLDSYPILMSNRRAKRPVVALWGHGRDNTRASSGLDRAVQRWITSRADWFFAYTNGGASSLIEDGFPSANLTVVQNSIDTRALRSSVESVSDPAIDSYAAQHDLRGKTALFLGGLDQSKRLQFLIDSSSIAHELDPDYRLLVGGDGAERSFVEAAARSRPWLTYLGSLSGDQKACALAASQVLAMPGRVGLVAVDSFAAATPVITTRWPWHAPEFEYLEDGITAIITEDTTADFADGLARVLRSQELLRRLVHGCNVASDVYTIEMMVENFLEGIVSALEPGRS